MSRLKPYEARDLAADILRKVRPAKGEHERPIMGWEAAHAALCVTEDGKSIISLPALRSYADILERVGAITRTTPRAFKTKDGEIRSTPSVAVWPSRFLEAVKMLLVWRRERIRAYKERKRREMDAEAANLTVGVVRDAVLTGVTNGIGEFPLEDDAAKANAFLEVRCSETGHRSKRGAAGDNRLNKRLKRHEALEQRLLLRDDLNSGQRLVIQCLLAHRNRETGLCCPSQVTVAREVGLARTTVNVILGQLEAKGIIRSIKLGTYKPKRYYFRSLPRSQREAAEEYEESFTQALIEQRERKEP